MQFIKAVYFFLFLLFSCLLICNCAAPKVKMYKDETTAINQQATISVEDRENKRGRLMIVKVDGETTIENLQYLIIYGGKYAGTVYILPGIHNLTTRFDYPGSSSTAWNQLCVYVESGKAYTLKARTEGYGVNVWLEDELGNIISFCNR